MFLISKDGMTAVEANKIRMDFDYDEKTKEECNIMYRDVASRTCYYGSIESANNIAKIKCEEYLKDKNKICTIRINGELDFGKYGEVQGKIVFEEIVNALKNESAYFDMREVDFGESEN